MMKKLLLILIGVVFGAVIAEILLGFTDKYSFNEVSAGRRVKELNYLREVRPSREYGYELVPNANKFINSLGMMDKEYSSVKPEGTFRILLLGDSVSQWGRWSEQLETELNRKRKTEILNTSVAGWKLYQMWKYCKLKNREYGPDLTIVAVNINDIPNYLGVKTVYLDKKNKSLLQFSVKGGWRYDVETTLKINPYLYVHSNLYRFIVTTLFSKKMSLEQTQSRLGSSADMLNEMKEICGGKLLGIVFPYIKQLKDYSENEAFEYSWTLSELENAGIDYIDFTPYFNKFGAGIISFKLDKVDVVHFNDKGNLLIAGEVQKWLKRKTGLFN